MRVMFVSTWGSPCGIATYTEELIEGARGLWESCVAGPAENGFGIRETPSVPARQYWQRNSSILDQSLLQAVEDFKPDVVHIQHEHGLFQFPSMFIRTVRALRSRVPTIVTLHTVNWTGNAEHTLWFKDLGQCVDRLIVHTYEAWASTTLYMPNVTKIPHGTSPLVTGSRDLGVKLLDPPPGLARLLLADDHPVVCLLHGFIGAGKNLICTIRAIATAEARNMCRPIIVIISGAAEDVYIRQFQWALGTTGLELRSIVYPTFVAARDVPNLFALADFGVLNTTSWTLSASGAAHVYARHGIPVAAANRPIYYDVIRGGAPTFDLAQTADQPTDAAVDIVAALASNVEMRQCVAGSIRDWAVRTQWQEIAKRHLDLYEAVIAARQGK